MTGGITISGWAFSWFRQISGGMHLVNPDLDTLEYSADFTQRKEFIYDHRVEFCLFFRIRSSFDRSVIRAEMKTPENKTIFLCSEADGFSDPGHTYNEFDLKDATVKLFWPTHTPHTKGVYTITVDLGWKSSPQAGIAPQWLPRQIPPLKIEIKDIVRLTKAAPE